MDYGDTFKIYKIVKNGHNKADEKLIFGL
jgi:hypothetical protein